MLINGQIAIEIFGQSLINFKKTTDIKGCIPAVEVTILILILKVISLEIKGLKTLYIKRLFCPFI